MDERDDVAALVRRAADGDHGAYDAIVKRFAGLVWHIGLAHRLSPPDAADVSQTVWLRLVEQLGRIREPERLGAWLATTARHECLAVLRRSQRSIPVDLDAPDAPMVTTGDDVVGSTRLEDDEQAVTLRAAWARLPERCQALLSLLLADPPASYDEIAEALAMPVGSIGPTRLRCLHRLRNDRTVAGITEAAGRSGSARHP